MLSKVHSAALVGIDAHDVLIEVNTDLEGEPKTFIVGLPDTSVRESQDRVHSAIINSGCRVPYTKTTINLAPGDLKKEGPAFDLPIALGLLDATDQLPSGIPQDLFFAGELSLSGELRPIKGALPYAILARKKGFSGIVLPRSSAFEAALVDGISVYPADSLSGVRAWLQDRSSTEALDQRQVLKTRLNSDTEQPDFSDIKGQVATKRAIEIAVAGSHNILMIGPPGSGKSMIAKRIPSIMPEPSIDEFLEILSIHSSAGITLSEPSLFERPYREPHHTISDAGLLGGGTIPGPGEISLAHNGVLFLDELPEFRRSTLEVLRQPLEEGSVTISRSRGKLKLPCSFMLVAAMNPTPCGADPRAGQQVRSTPSQIQKYRSKVSGPLLDRIDIHIDVPSLSLQELRNTKRGEGSQAIRERIVAARTIQQERYRGTKIHANARMDQKGLREFCSVSENDGKILEHAMDELQLSARAYDRILKVSRTIADLEGSTSIQNHHLMEAIQYRSLDRNLFY